MLVENASWVVLKFVPDKCPGCGASLANANIDTLLSQSTGFLTCPNCSNTTMVISRQRIAVSRQEEAQQLLKEGYTAVLSLRKEQDASSGQKAPLPEWFIQVHAHLCARAQELREELSAVADPHLRASRFEGEIFPHIAEIIYRVRNEQRMEGISPEAKTILKNEWNNLTRTSKELLLAAQIIRNNLLRYLEHTAENPTAAHEADFSAPIILCGQVIEHEIKEKIFIPFRKNHPRFYFEYMEDSPRLSAAVTKLDAWCRQEDPLALNDACECLLQLGGPRALRNKFKNFLQQHLKNYETLIVENVLPQRIFTFLTTYRNRCSIIGPVSYSEYQRCEDLLLRPPVKLLALLAEAT